MRRIVVGWLFGLLAIPGTLACGEDSGGDSGDGATTGGSAGTGGSRGGSGGSRGGSGGSAGGGIISVPGEPDDSVDTALPPVPRMVNVRAKATDDSVNITFNPIDGAADYRVYELPPDDAISSTSDGHVTVQNALYRCAGHRQAPPVQVQDDDTGLQSPAMITWVEGKNLYGHTRTLDDARLGYVYAEPGEGRIPVHALGDSASNADNGCYFMRWRESRVKQYVTSEAERAELLADGSRDDGIVFYVPADPSAATKQVYTVNPSDARLYFAEGPEADVHADEEPAFLVLAEEAEGTIPLMRVYYENVCGRHHDELAPGLALYERARTQGEASPLLNLHWSGIEGPTTLVVEALDQGCPNLESGLLSPVSKPAYAGGFGQQYVTWVTVEEARAAASAGEVYVNGEAAPDTRPRPIARSFVRIEPGPKPDLDWFHGFGPDETLGTFAELPCGEPMNNCWQEFRQGSEVGDFAFIRVETERHAFDKMFGELWVMYADAESDVNGKFRLTPATKGRVTADTYLYATMEVSSFTTGRRYPQFLISDQDAPVHHNMERGNTVVIQTFGDWPYEYQVEVCDHRQWDVNNQCPKFDLYRLRNPSDSAQVTGYVPNHEVGEQTGWDRSTHLEVYMSSQRIYLMLEGEPYGCAELPTAGVPSGDVTVTYGDVLYHSGVDHLEYFTYPRENYQVVSQRHFDNLGFKSNVAAPDWDEARYPCTSTIFQ